MLNPFRPFVTLLRLIWGMFTGAADEANDALLKKNPNLIRHEGKMAKGELQQAYKSLYDVVASKTGRSKEKEASVGRDTKRLELIAQAKSGMIKTGVGKDPIEKMGFQLWQVSQNRIGATKAFQDRATALEITDVIQLQRATRRSQTSGQISLNIPNKKQI